MLAVTGEPEPAAGPALPCPARRSPWTIPGSAVHSPRLSQLLSAGDLSKERGGGTVLLGTVVYRPPFPCADPRGSPLAAPRGSRHGPHVEPSQRSFTALPEQQRLNLVLHLIPSPEEVSGFPRAQAGGSLGACPRCRHPKPAAPRVRVPPAASQQRGLAGTSLRPHKRI